MKGGGSNSEHHPVFRAPLEGGLSPRSTLKNYMKKVQTDKRTMRIYKRIGLRAHSLKIARTISVAYPVVNSQICHDRVLNWAMASGLKIKNFR